MVVAPERPLPSPLSLRDEGRTGVVVRWPFPIGRLAFALAIFRRYVMAVRPQRGHENGIEGGVQQLSCMSRLLRDELSLPGCSITNHGIEDGEQFAHTGDDGDLLEFAGTE